jgi:hypothetical protein
MRSGKWKYIRDGSSEFLHDLSIDERENANFAKTEVSVFERLRNEFQKWESGMVKYS